MRSVGPACDAGAPGLHDARTSETADLLQADARPLRSAGARASPSRAARRAAGASRVGPQRAASSGSRSSPGQLVAAQSRVNGHVVVERAVGTPIAPNLVRDGEVTDVDALSAALAELFDGSGLDRRVRIGIANQRIVMRQIELPPITDPKELDSAVHFQAQDEIPMPIESVVLDYHPLGIVETDGGPAHAGAARRRAARHGRAHAARRAPGRPAPRGRRPRGVRHDPRAAADGLPEGEQVLYLSIGGLTNLAIASGPTCEFTRVITTGVEQIVAEVAARAGVPLADARRLIAARQRERGGAAAAGLRAASRPGRRERRRRGAAADHAEVARAALADGIRRIAAEVRNSLDFHLGVARRERRSRARPDRPGARPPRLRRRARARARADADARRGRARVAERRRTRADEPARRRGRPVVAEGPQ